MSDPLRSTPRSGLTDEHIMSAAIEAADALDATRVSELRAGKWHATTIFDGDTGLLRFGRLVEAALRSHTPSETKERLSSMANTWWKAEGEDEYSRALRDVGYALKLELGEFGK